MLTVVRRAVPALDAGTRERTPPGAAAGLRGARRAIGRGPGLTLERLLPVGSLDCTDEAAGLLLRHARGRVLVVGDFDADGATSTALMLRALRGCGFASVDFLVPNRFEFGYGLTPEIVAWRRTREPTLIVTVDNGISSHRGRGGRARARHRRADHRSPPARRELPDANVIVNPNLPGSPFGSRALAGVGVAFYVLAALQRLLQREGVLPGAPRRWHSCWTWSRWEPWRTWCRWMPTTASWWRRACGAFAPGAACPASRALLEIAKRIPRSSSPQTWASRSRRGSTPPAGSTT